MNAKTYTIAVPMKNFPYSRREVVFDKEPTDQEIEETALLFAKINNTFETVSTATTATPLNITLLKEENAQLKAFQDKTMQMLEYIKTRDPDLFNAASESVIL